ncbi:inner membrane-spanning protein YciB [Paracoccaceae bacterium GXU_MW_L88]
MQAIRRILTEFGPIILFFVAYRMAPVAEGLSADQLELEKLLFATKLFIPAILLALGVSWVAERRLPPAALLTAVIVLLFGGLAIVLRDATFVKMKPTIIYAAFAAILGFGIMRGTSYLRLFLSEALAMTEEGWMILTKRFAWFFLAMAVANELVWRLMGTETWVTVKTFVLPIAMFVFIFAQAGVFTRYSTEDTDTSGK